MGMRIPPLHKIKIMFESNPLKSRILVLRLAVDVGERSARALGQVIFTGSPPVHPHIYSNGRAHASPVSFV